MKSEYAEDLGIKTGITSRNDLISSHAVLGEVAPRKGLHLGRVVVHCGNCNSTNIRLNIDSNNQKHFNFCPDCGTKVDWRNLA